MREEGRENLCIPCNQYTSWSSKNIVELYIYVCSCFKFLNYRLSFLVCSSLCFGHGFLVVQMAMGAVPQVQILDQDIVTFASR